MSNKQTTKKAGRGVKGDPVGMAMKTDWARVSLEEARGTAQLLAIQLKQAKSDALKAKRPALADELRDEVKRAEAFTARLNAYATLLL